MRSIFRTLCSDNWWRNVSEMPISKWLDIPTFAKSWETWTWNREEWVGLLFSFSFCELLLVMEMINHSKLWRCLEIFAFSYLVFKREVLLQTYCGVDNFSSWLVFSVQWKFSYLLKRYKLQWNFASSLPLIDYWEHMWFHSFASFTESLYGHSVFSCPDNVVYYFVNLNFE